MSAMLHVRLDEDLKARGVEALNAMGMTTSDAVRLLFHRIVADQCFPLELKVPNSTTRAAMAESDEIVRARKARFENAEILFDSLDP